MAYKVLLIITFVQKAIRPAFTFIPKILQICDEYVWTTTMFVKLLFVDGHITITMIMEVKWKCLILYFKSPTLAKDVRFNSLFYEHTHTFNRIWMILLCMSSNCVVHSWHLFLFYFVGKIFKVWLMNRFFFQSV